MNGTRNREVGEYLRRLQRSMGDLPPQRRDEILAEIEEHIDAGLAEIDEPTDADVRNVLERLGDPADIAAEARERFGITPRRPRRTDPLAIILLLVGGFVGIGWLIGVVLLWISEAWNTRDKLIGTLIVPFGLAGSLGLVLATTSRETCAQLKNGPTTCVSHPVGGPFSGGAGQVLVVFVVLAPIAVALYLGWRLSQARTRAALAS